MTSTEHVGKNAPLDLAKLEADVTAGGDIADEPSEPVE